MAAPRVALLAASRVVQKAEWLADKTAAPSGKKLAGPKADLTAAQKAVKLENYLVGAMVEQTAELLADYSAD